MTIPPDLYKTGKFPIYIIYNFFDRTLPTHNKNKKHQTLLLFYKIISHESTEFFSLPHYNLGDIYILVFILSNSTYVKVLCCHGVLNTALIVYCWAQKEEIRIYI